MKEVHSNRGPGAPLSICVAGVGSGGCRAVSRMAARWTEGPAIAALDTDAQVLAECPAGPRLQLGKTLTQGLGAGGDVSAGRAAAEEERERLRALFSGADLVFLVAALGGGTGTGAAPVVARAARDEGALVLGFATLPFQFEGEARRTQAMQGLAALRDEADAVVAVPNQRLFELVKGGATAEQAFAQADDVLGAGIQAIWNLLARRGLISLSFADLRSVVQNSGGTCVFGYGEAMGDARAPAAAQAALENPLLDRGRAVASARALLVSIVGGPDLSLAEIESIMNTISSSAHGDAHICMGAASHPDWIGRLSVTILASEQWQQSPAAKEEEEAAAEGAEAADDAPGAKKKRRSKATQTKLSLDPSGRGRFKDVEATIIDGQDLDIPTFKRRGIAIEKL
jgi:cell division protein FtsZ